MSIGPVSQSSPSLAALNQITQSAGVQNLNPAQVPADVRDGNSAAQQAYGEGLAFEKVLVNQLSQQLAQTMQGSSGTDASSDDSSSDDSSSGGLLSGPASGFASLIPQALTGSIMQAGGLGVASEIAKTIDPALANGTVSGPAHRIGQSVGGTGGVPA